MSKEWHYSRDGQTFGPVNGAALKELAASGKIRPTDSVWSQGMAEWVPAARVQGLFVRGGSAAAPPPPPPSQPRAPSHDYAHSSSLPETAQPDPRRVQTLYSPVAAANWSILFTPVFGALIHAENWRRLGEPARAASSMLWAKVMVLVWIGFLVVGIIGQVTTVMTRDATPLALIQFCFVAPAWLGAIFGWYFGSASAQVKFVEERFPTGSYPRRPWGNALWMAVLGMVGWGILSLLANFVVVGLLGALR